MRSIPTLQFKPIDLNERAELTVMFRIDAFICSDGNADKFGKKNSPQAKLYLKWLHQKLSTAPASVIHAWLNDSIVGQIELGEDKDDSSIGYVHLYYLIPEIRGMKLGDQLDQYAMTYCRTHGYQKMRLSVSKSNKRALKFYKRLGWHVIGDKPGDSESSLMEKDL